MSASCQPSPDAWVQAITRMILRLVLLGGAAFGAVYVLGRLKPVLISLFVAAILAYIIRPIACWMAGLHGFRLVHRSAAALLASLVRGRTPAKERQAGLGTSKQSPVSGTAGTLPLGDHALRVIASLYVLVLMMLALWLGLRLVANPFIQEARNLALNMPRLERRLEKQARDLREWYRQNVPERTRQWVEEQLARSNAGAQFSIQTKVTQWGQEGLKSVAGALKNVVELVLLPVLAFYFAVDSKKLKHEFVALLPRERRKETMRLVHDFNRIMYSYVVGQCILCVLAGVIVGLGLWALGMDYWVTLGLLAGVTRAIPIIGPIVGGVPIVLLALITRGLGVALAVLIFFTCLHFAESKFLMPMVIGDRMRLHPVLIIIVLLIGGEFGGLLGMFFAPPLAAILRVAVRRYWLARVQHRRVAASAS
ncbi:MAG: AI-2E family transporter [Chthonomonadales bacterium]